MKEPCGAALLDIRNQAIIMEYLLKNVGIFFDKNLASAAVAFYPETEETPTPAADLGMLSVFRQLHINDSQSCKRKCKITRKQHLYCFLEKIQPCLE